MQKLKIVQTNFGHYEIYLDDIKLNHVKSIDMHLAVDYIPTINIEFMFDSIEARVITGCDVEFIVEEINTKTLGDDTNEEN